MQSYVILILKLAKKNAGTCPDSLQKSDTTEQKKEKPSYLLFSIFNGFALQNPLNILKYIRIKPSHTFFFTSSPPKDT